jgi:hypothetical protein
MKAWGKGQRNDKKKIPEVRVFIFLLSFSVTYTNPRHHLEGEGELKRQLGRGD